jgi:hypothetical protein
VYTSKTLIISYKLRAKEKPINWKERHSKLSVPRNCLNRVTDVLGLKEGDLRLVSLLI